MVDQNYTVLFADISGSMALYQSLGDEQAKSLVIDLQARLSTLINEQQGTVQDIIGDEIMARFDNPDSALQCAANIHLCADSFGREASTTLTMRIGVHTGPAIVEGQRMFGDTVNLAARVAAIAKGGQTIITSDTHHLADPEWQALSRQFDVASVKGKSEPITIYLLPWRENDLTVINTPDSTPTETTGNLQLTYANQQHDLLTHEGVFSIGRAVTNHLVIDAEPVSRRHTTIELQRGRYVVTDNSTNGTHVYLHTGEVIYLRREQLPLWGTGQFALGAPSNQASGHVIEFALQPAA